MRNIISLSDFRKNTTALVKEINESCSPLILTQNGKAAAVILSPEVYEQTRKSQAMIKLLSLREEQAREDEDRDFDEVMDEMDAMIEAHHGE